MTSATLGETDTSAHRAEQMLQKGEWAVAAFSTFRRPAVLRIAEAAAKAAAAKAAKYADWAVEETGFGVTEHKKLKNELCSVGIFEHYKDHDYTGYRIDRRRKIIEVARPAGVVFALTPSTNPVCSVFYKIMLALLTRNAVVISPHPAAKRCCTDAALTMAEAAEAAGAPDGVIQVLAEPNLALIDRMMKSERTAVILATGGTPMVRAAYSSGSPALGVGPGNCPAYVDASADVPAAARRLVDSKSFDNSVLCTNESAIIAHADVSAALKRELKSNGAYLCTHAEAEQVEAGLFPGGKFNVAMLGRPAAWIARECGFSVPEATRILAVPLTRIGDDYPLSREKLCPVIGYYEVPNAEAGLTACQAMVRRHGTGHSAALHCHDPRVTLRFGSELNVLRIAVNAPCSVGAAGFETHLAPSMTVGTGFFGRSSIDENVGPQHLVQWARVAFHKDEEVDFSRYEGLPLYETPGSEPPPPAGGPPATPDVRAEIRRIILEELGNLRAELV